MNFVKPSVAHKSVSVLCIGIADYSLHLQSSQNSFLSLLRSAVDESLEYRQALETYQVTVFPLDSGMVLVFHAHPRSAVQCASDIYRSLRQSPIQLRVGVHTCSQPTQLDPTARSNFVENGIETATLVAERAGVGKIFLSQAAMEELQSVEEWSRGISDLGIHPIKGGASLHLYELCYPGQPGANSDSSIRAMAPEAPPRNPPETQSAAAQPISQLAVAATTLGASSVLLPAGFHYAQWPVPPWVGAAFVAVGTILLGYGVWELAKMWPPALRTALLAALVMGTIWYGTVSYAHSGDPGRRPPIDVASDPQKIERLPILQPKEPEKHQALYEVTVHLYNGTTLPDVLIDTKPTRLASYSSGLAKIRLPEGSHTLHAIFPTELCDATVAVPAKETIEALCSPR